MIITLENTSPTILERAEAILKRLAFLGLAILALSLFAHKIIDTDIWWHLRTGKLILESGRIPATDPYSFTAGGNQWIDLHWLFQLIVYTAYHTFGSYALSLLFVAVYSATFYVTWLSCRRPRSRLLALLFIWLALLAGSFRFLARPEAFTYLMIALYTLLLIKHDRGRIGARIFLLVPLQIIWTNLQALFILGPCLIIAYFLDSILIDREKPYFSIRRRWDLSVFSDRKTLRLGALFALTVAASLINPYGLKGLLFPATLFTRVGGMENVFANSVAEFQPPFSGYNVTSATMYFAGFLALSALALALDWRNARLSHIFIFLGMGYLALNARRNVPVFMLAVLPFVVVHARNVVDRWRMLFNLERRHSRGLAMAAYLMLMAIMAVQTVRIWNNRYYISDKRAERFGIGFKEHSFPQESLSFIKEKKLSGPFFNSLDAGGMFIWQMFPSEKVFIDPRLEVNTETVLAEYCSVLSNPKQFSELADQYGFNAALISHTSQDGLFMAPIIYSTPGWFLVHLDPVAAVFARATSKNVDVIARNRIDITRWKPPTVAPDDPLNGQNPDMLRKISDWINVLAPSDADAQIKFNLGLVFLVMGQNEQAAEQLKAGLELQPDSPEAYYNMGLAFDRMGRQETALYCYKKAVALDWRHALAHTNLGRIYDERGLKDEAEREYKLALRWNEDEAIALYNLGALYLENGRYDNARKYLTRALKADPSLIAAREALQQLENK
ncbi:MAG: tetratricopeptide repeat protein [Candidatus Abyssobacteria bacterium SURF_5]|uniref:Tetratricopeptide repeat protein n=1 Tax=Abyssobacteria bacterium (strain SURF_5) TaxID=2093360 RepID=A0A3A4P241_ABYX5|nr:MAG: tetratricopeptide repeat protein [Candidatus Abyssubacteria bacterium SURF_5]